MTIRQGTDDETLRRHFGRPDLAPMWIAEPDVELAPPIVEALQARGAEGWYGYEVRSGRLAEAFWAWMQERHAWSGEGLTTTVSPSVGTSLAVLIREMTEPGDGVIIQPPVFTDFKPLIGANDRTVARNPLTYADGAYGFDLDDLEAKASVPENRLLILCSPHNPVGRVWRADELEALATICAANDVFVIADEIHADIVLGGHQFVPFAEVAAASGVRWAATHGPIKTFGLAGVCDTLVVADAESDVVERFERWSSQLHLTRNNGFSLAAFEAAYRDGSAWFDQLLERLATNISILRTGLGPHIGLVEPEGTFMTWLDFTALGVDPGEMGAWLGRAGVALSPGHWFGREGAGFARMTIAADSGQVEAAAKALAGAASSV